MKILIILLLLSSSNLCAEIVVIGNIDSDLTSITQKEVKDLYMGRSRSLPNGSFALPLDQNELRSYFYHVITDRPIEQVNAYWARIMFSGQASPPMKLPDSQAVVKVVSENKGAIGYVDKKIADQSHVQILLILKE